jgi:hypothetical protein
VTAGGTLAKDSNSPISVAITQNGQLSPKGLALHWTLANHWSKPISVYSTFLNGPSAGHRIHFPKEAELFTSLMEISDVDVNAYPKATFITLQPGERVEGDFKESPSASRWAKPGMQLCFDVAYGSDLDSEQRAIDKQGRNPQGGHPANPIAQWQRISQSGQITLR